MPEFCIPTPAWDEASRLEALRALQLLDTPPEVRFDRVTSMAKDMFGVSIALISLVDHSRQWFKSRQGLDVTETPRAISFCGHAILQDDIFIVEDATRDARFAGNPLVTGAPHIRFYAGKPLYSIDRKKVGTLCLIDSVPRALTEGERNCLHSLGAWAEREINAFSAESEHLLRLENRLRLAHVLENAVEGIIGTDFDGRIEVTNPAACEIFRYRADELVGKNIRELIPPREHARHSGYMERLRSGTAGNIRNGLESVGLRCDGEEFPIEVSFRMQDSGKRKFFTGIVRDITERKNLERIKSEFVAGVSHELRTPLTSIMGALSMACEGDGHLSPQELRELIDIGYLNAKRLNALVNDILDTEKLDAGMMDFQFERVGVREVMEEARLLNLPFARKLKVTLEVKMPDFPLYIRADHSRLIQVLTNLISNACKFSPADQTVQMVAERRGDAVCISVSDRGPGIPDEFRTRIFQRFAQAHAARNHNQTGTGLGLSLCKAMIEKMGGRIDFESTAGQGACFYIELATLA